MSMLGATLTLPGIAGIVLTVGMAVDANVLIFSRIREEVNNGLAPQMAIHSGFERAVATILDANITTLIVAVILYAVGTGPIKGFAVTLSIGILTSMFTAIMGTRAIINLIYGGRKVNKLSIGGIKA
jgi:preprotein translocase subunit SecD